MTRFEVDPFDDEFEYEIYDDDDDDFFIAVNESYQRETQALESGFISHRMGEGVHW